MLHANNPFARKSALARLRRDGAVGSDSLENCGQRESARLPARGTSAAQSRDENAPDTSIPPQPNAQCSGDCDAAATIVKRFTIAYDLFQSVLITADGSLASDDEPHARLIEHLGVFRRDSCVGHNKVDIFEGAYDVS